MCLGFNFIVVLCVSKLIFIVVYLLLVEKTHLIAVLQGL